MREDLGRGIQDLFHLLEQNSAFSSSPFCTLCTINHLMDYHETGWKGGTCHVKLAHMLIMLLGWNIFNFISKTKWLWSASKDIDINLLGWNMIRGTCDGSALCQREGVIHCNGCWVWGQFTSYFILVTKLTYGDATLCVSMWRTYKLVCRAVHLYCPHDSIWLHNACWCFTSSIF